LTTGTYNVVLGLADLQNATDYNSIVIGSSYSLSVSPFTAYPVVGQGSNTVTIGNSLMTKISGQVAWTSTSDLRLKENIQSSALGLDFIRKLRPVTYNFITQPGVVQEGLIAQEVEAAAQSLGTTFHAVKVPTTPESYYSLTYSDFVMPLINATKELKAENDALKAGNDALKAENEAQKARLDRLERQVAGLLALVNPQN